MNLLRLASALGGLALLASGLSSCLTEPSYSTTPEITFNQILVRRGRPNLPGVTPPQVDPQGLPTDTVRITINYQDGDGDLGLNKSDALYRTDSINYYVQPFLKNTATNAFEPILATLTNPSAPAGSFLVDNGTFPHITTNTDTRSAPIKGTLTRKLFYNYGSPFIAGQTVRFQVSIVDRAHHKSNVITTSEIVIAQR